MPKVPMIAALLDNLLLHFVDRWVAAVVAAYFELMDPVPVSGGAESCTKQDRLEIIQACNDWDLLFVKHSTSARI
jgi:hypothetical protein